MTRTAAALGRASEGDTYELVSRRGFSPVPHVAWLPCRKTVSGSRPSAGASVGLHTTAQYEMGRSVRTSSSISASSRYSWLVTAYGPRPVGSSATGEPTATEGRSRIASVSAIGCRSACIIRCDIRRRKTRVERRAQLDQQTRRPRKCDGSGSRSKMRAAAPRELDTPRTHTPLSVRARPCCEPRHRGRAAVRLVSASR